MKRIILYCLLWGLLNSSFFIDDNKLLFILLSLLIIFSSSNETIVLFRKYGITVLLSPFVICCLYLFSVSFGLSNLIFIVPDYAKFFEYFVHDYFTNQQDFYFWLCQGLNYVFTGFLFLLAGYKFEEKTKFITNFTHSIFQSKRLLVKEFDIKLWKIAVLWLVSCAVKIYSISMGLYGFTASSIALEENKGAVQFIYYGTITSKAALFLLSLLYFVKPKKFEVKFLLILVISTELIFGLLSGFKSGVMFPFIIFLFASIIIKKSIRLKFVVPVILSVFLAYALVEPMRQASYGYQSDKKVDAAELIEIASTGITEKSVTESNTIPFLYIFLFRNGLSMFLALSAKETIQNKKFYPQFEVEKKMLLAPVLAYVPRAIWPNKPIISNGGVLYNREFLGANDDDNVSVATSPFGYFLFGTHNALVYVIAFFFLLGMLQFYIFHLFLNYGLGGLIVCLGMLMTFGIVEEPYGVLISYFKELPMFIFFQFIFLYKFKSTTGTKT